jgi:hypothetical protein
LIQPGGGKSSPPITETGSIVVRNLEIYSVHQTEGSAYDQVTITGKFFGTKKGAVYLKYGEGENLIRKSCKLSSWMMDPATEEGEIVFVVPKGLAAGTYDIIVTNSVGSDSLIGEFSIE